MPYEVLFHVSGSTRDGLEFHLDLVHGNATAENKEFVFEFFQDCCESGDVAATPVFPNRYYTAEYHWEAHENMDGEVDYYDWLENVKPHHRIQKRRNVFKLEANVTMNWPELERAAKLKPHLPRKLKKQLKHKGWDWKRYWFLSRTQDEQLGYGVAHGSQVQELDEAADARCLEHMLAAAANHNSSDAGESACTP